MPRSQGARPIPNELFQLILTMNPTEARLAVWFVSRLWLGPTLRAEREHTGYVVRWSQTQLASALRCSEKTVQRAIDTLCCRGVIETVDEGDGYHTATYALVYDERPRFCEPRAGSFAWRGFWGGEGHFTYVPDRWLRRLAHPDRQYQVAAAVILSRTAGCSTPRRAWPIALEAFLGERATASDYRRLGVGRVTAVAVKRNLAAQGLIAVRRSDRRRGVDVIELLGSEFEHLPVPRRPRVQPGWDAGQPPGGPERPRRSTRPAAPRSTHGWTPEALLGGRPRDSRRVTRATPLKGIPESVSKSFYEGLDATRSSFLSSEPTERSAEQAGHRPRRFA